ncbi:MAG: hypothetical protein U0Q18_06650 [Bryobacteraceae bacterium]
MFFGRRQFLSMGVAGGTFFSPKDADRLPPVVVSVNVMFDRGAHNAKGLTPVEIALFHRHQERARREFGTSGITFDLHLQDGAFLREQGYSDIPSKFLAQRMINLFVTTSLGYDIDRDRTGGCSMGPIPPSRKSGGDPFYKTFVGLREAGENTLQHEYAHHFTLDTLRHPTAVRNFWADFRNDYLLWLQRRGEPVAEFRACAHSEWARLQSAG